jgi:lipoprotein-anchoring transpeptidase ErfK/SrfK
VTAAVIATFAAGCGGSSGGDAPVTAAAAPAVERPGSVAPQATTTTQAPANTVLGETIETPSGVVPSYPAGYSLYEPGKTVVAQVLPGEASIEVYESATSLRPIRTLANPVRPGTPLVFVAEGKTPDRLHVQLPMRPNGSKGWIDITKVSLAAHEFRVDVSLSEFRITVRDGATVILEAPVGIGEDEVPSPDGSYYITELLQPPTKNSVYGTYAYGLSGFSEVLQEFNGGNGQVGIHGTNQPQLIGKKVSNGCIRLRNEDIERLVPVLPLGTPVHIRA